MENCLHTGMIAPLSPVHYAIDAQLYGDLGYGELSYYMQNMVKIYYNYVKVQRKDDGAEVKVNAAARRAVHNLHGIDMYIRWVNGNTECE